MNRVGATAVGVREALVPARREPDTRWRTRDHPGTDRGRGVLALALGEVGSRPGDVTIDIPAGIPLVVADPVLLQRVVVNLATNAIRFACDGVPPASGCGISRTRMLGGSMMRNVRMAGRAQGM